MTEIAVIIVNYNTIRLVTDLIRSIKKHVRPHDYTIIVVDNNSKDNISILKKLDPKIKLIKSKKNTGFAGGNNIGIKAVKAKYYCLVNPDIILMNDAVHLLKKALTGTPGYGIAGPAIYDPDQRPQDEYYGFRKALYELSSILKLNRIYTWNYQTRYKKEIAEVDWVTGAFYMFKKELLDRIGFMEESYFLYSEETDYCLRAGRSGFKSIRVKSAQVIHLESASTASISGFRLYYQYRSKLKFIKKFYGIPSYLTLKTIYFFDISIKLVIRGFLEKTGLVKQSYIPYYLKLLNEIISSRI